MVALLALLTVLWAAAVIVLVRANDTTAHVETALASRETIAVERPGTTHFQAVLAA